MMKALINVRIYDFNKYIDCGYILFDEKIIETGTMEKFDCECEVIDGHNGLVLPGLVNGHTHIYSTLVRGLDMHANPKTFKGVLDDIWWKFDSYLELEDLRLSSGLYAEECLVNGVTSLIDHHASGVIEGSIDAVRKGVNSAGVKGLYCFETSDRFDLNASINENLSAIKDGDGLFGLHASLSLTDASLDLIAKNRSNAPIHVHAAESIEDQQDAQEKYGMRVVERFAKHGLLSEYGLLAHCVHINEEEARLVADNGCRIVINPYSNLNNAVGLFDFGLLRRHRIKFFVGTDGLGANVARGWQMLYYVGKSSLKDPSGIGFNEIIDSINESFDYFNSVTGHSIGRLEEGYSADFALFEYDPPTPITEHNVFGHVFFGIFDNYRPSYVFTDGVMRIKDYEVLNKANRNMEVVEKLWNRIGGK